MRVLVTCPCGVELSVAAWQIRAGRGKYCSKTCMYRYMVRPSGLTYDIKMENAGWFKAGQRASPETEFKAGELPHNFKGGQVGYDALHDWVKRYRGAAVRCEHCGADDGIHWANKSHEYHRDLDDWLQLCARCHKAYDKGHRGAMRSRFPRDVEHRAQQRARLRQEATT